MNDIRNIDILSKVTFSGPLPLADREVLTPAATEFLARLQMEFEDRRKKLIARRSVVQRDIDMGNLPAFDESRDSIRSRAWTVRNAPADLSGRSVEVTVPAGDTLGVIEAMNASPDVCVLDFEDTLSPGWGALIEGQRTIGAVARGDLAVLTPEGKRHLRRPCDAVMMVRPRGWHLQEKHLCVDGEPIAAALFDAGLFLVHNARHLVDRGSGPYLSIPKVENRYEAALWNDVLCLAERLLGLPHGSIRVSVLIETIHAAFEVDEILFELRDRSVGLAADHRDALFSFVKTFARYHGCILPDPAIGMSGGGFLRAIDLLMIQACHRRGTFAIGSPSAAVPPSNDPATREAVRESLRAEIEAGAGEGFDGTSVAYPALIRIAREVYAPLLSGGNRAARKRADVTITRDDLLAFPQGPTSEAGLRDGIDVAVRYLESWLSGIGSIALRGRLENAAGAELARAGVWQWVSHGVRLEEGTVLTPEVFRRVFSEEMGRISQTVGPERYRRGQFELASRLFLNVVHDPDFAPFITPKAYQHL